MNRIPPLNGGTPPSPPNRPNRPDETPGDDENLVKAEFEFDPYITERFPEIAEMLANTINMGVQLRTDLLEVLSDPNVKYFIGIESDLKPLVERFAGLKEPMNKYEFEKEFDFINNAAGYTGCCLGEKDDPRSTKAMFMTFFASRIINSTNRFEILGEVIRQLTFSKEVHKLFNDYVKTGRPMNFTYPRLLAKADEAVIDALEKIKGMLYPQTDKDLNTLLAAVKTSHKEYLSRISREEN